jgi:hypothetical protein
LIEIPDLNVDTSVHCGNRTKIADVAISADPDGRSFGQRATFLSLKPFVKFDRAAAHICMCGASHFEGLSKTQDRNAIVRSN